jgi:hypothetical protein
MNPGQARPAGATWSPANEVERSLYRALADGDAECYTRLLAGAPLYLPAFPDSPEGQRLVTNVRDGRTYVIVYTSPEALRRAAGERVVRWRITSLVEVVAARADPGWGVTVSPTTPIGTYLKPATLRGMFAAIGPDDLFRPANPTEAAMYRGRRDGDPGLVLDALVLATVLVSCSADGRCRVTDGTLPVFTSAHRVLEGVGDQVTTRQAGMVAVVRQWPEQAERLAVNPGSAIAMTFTAAQIPDLLAWAVGLARRAPSTKDPGVRGDAVSD